MPNDLAKLVNETLNKKSITPEDELADAPDEMARDIAILEPSPGDWEWWVSYLLQQMEFEAERRGKKEAFIKMMKSLMYIWMEKGSG